MNTAAPIETAERIDAASQFIAEGRFAEAETLVRSILEREPANADAINTLASIALSRRDGKRAYEILAPACTAYPDHPRLLANLGLAHMMLERPQEAVACLERAVALSPREVEFRLSLAQYLVAAGDAPRALTELDAALREGPDNVGALARLGVIAMGDGDWPRAEAAWRRAVALDPKNADTLHNLSVLCASTNRPEEATILAERAHLWAPLDLAKRVQFARCLAGIGDFQRAKTQCTQILMVAPEHLQATELFARLTLMRGAVPAGIETLSHFVRRHPKDPAAILSLAGALRFVGRMPQALTFVDQALGLDPGHPFGRRLRADLLLTLGRYAEVWPAAVPARRPDRVVAPKGTLPVEALLFARFLGPLNPDGVSLISEADDMTTGLLARVEGVELVRAAELKPEAFALPHAPAALGLTRETLTAAPRFLRPDPEQNERWRRAFAALPRPLIGVDWDQYPPGAGASVILPIAAAGGGTVVSLATDPERRQLKDWPKVIDAGASIRVADDLIGAISQLDAIVATDGLPLHVAGALGVLGIAVVACGYPWYFAAEGDRSLWYASLCVARQTALVDWDGAAAKAALLLAQCLSASRMEGAKT